MEDLRGPQGWTVALEDAPKGKGFVRVEVSRPLDFAVLQAGSTHRSFKLSLRINQPSVASQPPHPPPCGLLVHLYQYVQESGWVPCPDETARSLKWEKAMGEMMEELTLHDKASRSVQVNAPGTVKIEFGLTKRLKGVYCIGFRLEYSEGKQDQEIALYGPPMTMVGNTGKGRTEFLEALKEIVHHVYTQHSSTQNYDYVFLKQVINAACHALRGMEAFRDDDDLLQARSFLLPKDDHIDVLTELAWRVACTFGVAPVTGKLTKPTKLTHLWSKTNPKLIEGYLAPLSGSELSEGAKKMLEGLSPGSFVLRLSDNCDVSISYVSEERKVEKMGANYNSREKQFIDVRSRESYPSFGALLRASANKLQDLITYHFVQVPGGSLAKHPRRVSLAQVLQVCDEEKTPPLKKRLKKQDPLSDYKPVLEACDPLIRERLESLEEENQRLKNELESYRRMLTMTPFLDCGPSCSSSSSSTSAVTSPSPSQQPYSYLSSPDPMAAQQEATDATLGKRAREEEEEEEEVEEIGYISNDPTSLPPELKQYLQQSSPELASMGQMQGGQEGFDPDSFFL